MMLVRAFRILFIVVIVICSPLISAEKLEFRCPDPAQIIYKENVAQWYSRLTDGAPMLWEHFESAPAPEGKFTNGCVEFSGAIIEVDYAHNTYETRPACEYTSHLLNERYSEVKITLRPAEIFLEKDNRLTLYIMPGEKHWDLIGPSETLMYKCNGNIDACVFHIPPVSIRQIPSGFPEQLVKETISFRLFALRDQKQSSGWGTHNPVNISAFSDTKTRYFNSWNTDLKADSGTRLLVYRNETEQDAEKFLESYGLSHPEIPGNLRCDNENFRDKITSERYVILDILNKYQDDFTCHIQSTGIFRTLHSHEEL